MPFGGVKDWGCGRFGRKAAINEFTEFRWITIQSGTGIIRSDCHPGLLRGNRARLGRRGEAIWDLAAARLLEDPLRRGLYALSRSDQQRMTKDEASLFPSSLLSFS